MTVKTKPVPAAFQMFLLDKAKKRPERFSLLHPQVVSSTGALRDSLALATKDTLWISYDKDLTEALLKTVLGPPRSLGKALLIHAQGPSHQRFGLRRTVGGLQQVREGAEVCGDLRMHGAEALLVNGQRPAY